MTREDFKQFEKALKLCIAATGKTPPESISSAFWVILEPYPLLEVIKALKMRMSDPDKGRFIPAAAEIKELIESMQPKSDRCTATPIGLGQKPTDKLMADHLNNFMNLSPEERKGHLKKIKMNLRVGQGKGLANGFRRDEHDKLLESRKPNRTDLDAK